MGKFRDGMPVTAEAVSLILASIDRIKEILAGLEATETEPEGSDEDLIVKLHDMVEHGMAAMSAAAAAPVAAEPEPAPVVASPPVQPAIAQGTPVTSVAGTLVEQVLERPLRPGEVSLDDLERAFRETAIEIAPAPVAAPAAVARAAAPAPEAAPAPHAAKEASKEASKEA